MSQLAFFEEKIVVDGVGRWMPIETPLDENIYSLVTLVKVEGWYRYGLAVYWRGHFSLGNDPSVVKDVLKITHWLAVPKLC
jgi:hypothetical protein